MAAPDRVAMPLNRRKRAADTDGRPVDDPAAAKPQRQRKARGRGRVCKLLGQPLSLSSSTVERGGYVASDGEFPT